jgi:hypothetical protein
MLKDWFMENFDSSDMLAFVLLVTIAIFAIVGVTQFIEYGLGGFTGFLSKKALEEIKAKKQMSSAARNEIEEERKKTDKILEELEHEVEKKADLSGDDVAYALNDVLARIRSSKK